MVDYYREKTQEAWKLKALESRLPKNHPKKEDVLIDLKIKYAEMKGEKEILYRLNFLDKVDYIILNNIRLEDRNGHFQMDHIVLSKDFIVVVEAKNWLGTVQFGANGQVTQIQPDGTKKGFQNPVDQVKIQSLRLDRWLKQHNFSNIPILYLAVISLPTTIIERETPQDIIPPEVIHSSELIFRIQDIEQKYDQSILSNSQVYGLSKLLQSSHQPVELDLFKKYSLSSKDILRGVFCPKCSALPMVRYRKWLCLSCQYTSMDAHKQALRDYQLLVGDWITNKQAREFLHLSSPKTAQTILKEESKVVVGKNRGRKYRL